MPTARDVLVNAGSEKATPSCSELGSTQSSLEMDHALPATRVAPVLFGGRQQSLKYEDTQVVVQSKNEERSPNSTENEADNAITVVVTADDATLTAHHNGVAKDVEREPSLQAPSDRIAGKRAAARADLRAAIPESTTEKMAAVNNYYVSVSDPSDCSFQEGALPLLDSIYRISNLVCIQGLVALLFLSGFITMLVQLITYNGNSCAFTFICIVIFALEMTAVFGFERKRRVAAPGSYRWKLIEPAVIVAVAIFELVAWVVAVSASGGKSSAFAWLTFICLLLWFVHGSTRWARLQQCIRSVCSADRRRYQAEGFDLDLTYVHRNIAAMAWPAYNFERIFRNRIEDVVEFLDTKHPASYLVVNLSSERTYSAAHFHHQTLWVPMDDHNPAEMSMLVKFCEETTSFVRQDTHSRVVVVHCKGGKGRTGTVVCAFLMYTGLKRSATDALHHFAVLRTRPGASYFQGVQAPSQERYVRYFEKLMDQDTLEIPSRPVRIRKLRLYNIPWLWYMDGIGKLWFCVLLKPCSDRTVAFISNSSITFNPQIPDPSTYTAKQMRDLFGSDEENLYKQCNATDKNSSALTYRLDTTSFWLFVNNDFTQRMEYEEFVSYMNTHHADIMTMSPKDASKHIPTVKVSMELKRPELIPTLDGDVVFRFFYARDNPNPLEPPVQFWFHTGFEASDTLFLKRDQLDGPHKDKKVKRYPLEFEVEVGLVEVNADRE